MNQPSKPVLLPEEQSSSKRAETLLARKELLGVADLRHEYGLGRDLASQLIRLLPHIKVGKAGCGDRLMVRRCDIDRLCEVSSRTHLSLWAVARDFTPATLAEWMRGAEE